MLTQSGLEAGFQEDKPFESTDPPDKKTPLCKLFEFF
jgi:hypothetical protein